VQKPPTLSKSKRPQKRIKKPFRKKFTRFKSDEFKYYARRIFYILIGPLITWPILDESGPLRFIGFSLLFSGYHLFMLLFLDLLPEYVAYLQNEAEKKQLTPKQQRIVEFFSLFFFVVLGCFLGTLKILDHTVHAMPVFWSCILAGIALGIILVIRSVKKPFLFISTDNVNGFGIGFILGPPLLLCSFVFIANRYIPVRSIENKTVTLSSKSIGSGGRRSKDSHYVFLQVGGKTERFTVPEAVYDRIQDSAVCTMHQGIFGLYYIEKIAN
jgi:hypothetical protein